MSCLGRVAGTAVVAAVVAVVASTGEDSQIVALPAASKPSTAKPATTAAAPTNSCVELPLPGPVVRHSRGREPGLIPPAYKARYVKAADVYGLPWQLLAAVGEIETRHGAITATSTAGARGPMQFMPGTWARYGVEGDGDGRKDVTDPDDAIPAAASYLVASGAKQDVRKALFAYNRADWYVNDALTFAAAYGSTNCAPNPATRSLAVDGVSCPPTGSPAERGVQPATLAVMRCAKAEFPDVAGLGGLGTRPNKSDHPTGHAVDLMIGDWQTPAGNTFGWTVARWATANADRLGVSYVIWDDQIWRARSGTWGLYVHPNGPTRDPTLRHLDHVHVSVKR